ncbi:hypothetical protein [Enterocloster sp.]|uniref:hypothetical protein n=1 Tax=Enterocloster sp. TaxID=2719315 RepID=UPI0039A1B719
MTGIMHALNRIHGGADVGALPDTGRYTVPETDLRKGDLPDCCPQDIIQFGLGRARIADYRLSDTMYPKRMWSRSRA